MSKLNLSLIIITILATLFFYPQLPAQVPSHWNFAGQVDNYSQKPLGAWMIPLMAIVIFILFHFLPKWDPKHDKYKLFDKEWQIIQTAIIGFLLYLQGIVIYLSLNPEKPIQPFMFIGLGTMFVLIGNYLSKIRQNYFVGIKTPWALANEDNWNKTHRFGSWCFVIAGIVTLIQAYLVWLPALFLFSSIIVAALLPILYSFLLFKKQEHTMKYILAGLAGFILILATIRLMSTEDDWLCQNGQWVRHGNPSAPMPTTKCR